MEDCTRRVAYYDKKVFGTINEYWATAVKLIRAREVFAEFLGTFMLVVSFRSFLIFFVNSCDRVLLKYHTLLYLCVNKLKIDVSCLL